MRGTRATARASRGLPSAGRGRPCAWGEGGRAHAGRGQSDMHRARVARHKRCVETRAIRSARGVRGKVHAGAANNSKAAARGSAGGGVGWQWHRHGSTAMAAWATAMAV